MRVKKPVGANLKGSDQKNQSVSGLLSYKISYAADFTLQWDPPQGSKALAVSLSYHFPMEPDLESKMKAAIYKFLQVPDSASAEAGSKTGKTDRYLTPEHEECTISSDAVKSPITNNSKRRTTTPVEDVTLKVVSWDPQKGSRGGFSRDVKRRRYDTEEGVKVARNRGYACDTHRRQKLKCDPDVCPRNRQRVKELEANPQSSMVEDDLQMYTDCTSVSTLDTPVSTPSSVNSLIATFDNHTFKSQAATDWDSFAALPSDEQIIPSLPDFGTNWQANTHLTAQTIPLDDQAYDVPHFMLLDPNVPWEFSNPDTSSHFSYSWQGNSDFDPGIFFLPSPNFRTIGLPALSQLSEENVMPDYSQKDSLINADLHMMFSSKEPDYLQSIEFPEYSGERVARLAAISSNQTPGQKTISGSGTISDDGETPKITPWTFGDRPRKQREMTDVTITVGSGDNIQQITFSSKADLVKKLRKLLPDSRYSFNIQGYQRDMEERVSFCRANFEKKKVSKRLEEITYLEVRRSLKVEFSPLTTSLTTRVSGYK